MNDYPVSHPIKKIVTETPDIKTFYLNAPMKIEPGQFVMLWMPGFDEKPFALTTCNRGEIGVTVKERGPFTKKLFKAKPGDLLGVRGPYGKGFEFKGVKKACVVVGGVAIAAVMLLIEELKKEGAGIDFVQGCKCEEEVLFRDRVNELVEEQHIATVDGSCGVKGYCTVPLKKLLKEKEFDMLYCCGPEPMMSAVLDLCNEFSVQAQFSVERYMKCCMGICGQCSMDEFLCCVDGPVFSKKQLNKSKEFGKIHYTKTGRKEKI